MNHLVPLNKFLPNLEHAIEKSRIDSSSISEMIAEMGRAYLRLRGDIPRDNAWRDGKLKDSAGALQDVAQLALKLRISDPLAELVSFLAFVADIGRLVIVIEHAQGNKSRTQVAHGAASVELCSRCIDFTQMRNLESPVRKALIYHSLPQAPTREEIGDETAWVLCNLLRDIDKLSIIAGKSLIYVENPFERARQLVANKLEDSFHVSEKILRDFESGGPINRLECKTFVEWLLQFVAWKADFVFEETWELADLSKGYYFVLNYIHREMLRRGNDATRQCDQIMRIAHEVYGFTYTF